jgi:hypothetical protein
VQTVATTDFGEARARISADERSQSGTTWTRPLSAFDGVIGKARVKRKGRGERVVLGTNEANFPSIVRRVDLAAIGADASIESPAGVASISRNPHQSDSREGDRRDRPSDRDAVQCRVARDVSPRDT